ncbi:response regulator transcription factor [Novosphingobium sp.]|uniref:response regulator transcription factor n=1 Tax=Novosphingobium sp. TaxID=1874826 RepID=UPI002621BD69|nr:response regulator transcription factor [Novosphingobium sp.]
MTGTTVVLVVDDEASIRRLLRRALERQDYRVIEAGNARETVAALAIDHPEVVLLDLGLPDRDGLELVPVIKRTGTALLVVSARDATEEKVAALDLGADDYITKPFDTEEVTARVRTALRHRARRENADEETVRTGDLEIDFAVRRVTKGGTEIHLAPKEYAVLTELARNAGRVVTHAHLLRKIWGPAHEADLEYLRVTIRAIRRKLGEEVQSSCIRNEPAIGYRLIAG